MKNLENTKHVNHQSNRRKFIISTLSAGFAVAVCPLYAQSVKNSNKAEGIKSEQGDSESLLHDSGIRTIKLFLCGDVMTGRGIDQILAASRQSHSLRGVYEKRSRVRGACRRGERPHSETSKLFLHLGRCTCRARRLRKPDFAHHQSGNRH